MHTHRNKTRNKEKTRKPIRKRKHQSLDALIATHITEQAEEPSVEMYQAQGQSLPWPQCLYMEHELAGRAPFLSVDKDSPAPHRASKRELKQERRRCKTSPEPTVEWNENVT